VRCEYLTLKSYYLPMFVIVGVVLYSFFMEFNEPHPDEQTEKKLDISRVFGEGARKLIRQISYDDPTLGEDEVINYAWSLIPEVTAYAMPISQEDLTESAIFFHEGYEAYRRIKD